MAIHSMTTILIHAGRASVAVGREDIQVGFENGAGIRVDGCMSAAGARGLAHLLLTAADDFERLQLTARAGAAEDEPPAL
jgi:hypothetical protein